MGQGVEVTHEQSAALVAASVASFLVKMGVAAGADLIAAVADGAEPIRLAAGSTLFSAGDASDAAYFTISGRLLIVIDDDLGDRKVVRRVGSDQVVGEVGLLAGTPRTATVIADRDATLARLPRGLFEQLATTHPEFLMGVTRTVVSRLAQPRPAVNDVGVLAIVVPDPARDARVLTARMMQALLPKGSAVHLSAAAVDVATGGSADVLEIEQYLDQVEAANRFVLLEIGREATQWSSIALRRADRVIVVMGTDASPEVQTATLSFVETARTGHRPEIWLALARTKDAGPPRGSAAVAARYDADRVLHCRDGIAADIHRLARLITGTGVGLVLGGGGARGFAHLGVYRALTELGVPVDAVAGSSIGGIIGAGIATTGTPDELTKLVADGFSDVLDYTLPVVSMVKGSRITREIDRVFAGVDFEDLPVPFLCVSTNLTTSQQLVHDSGPVTVGTRAGLAIPGVIPPVPYEGDLLVDGGVLDNLPIGPMRASGLVDTVIAVDVAPPTGPRARADYGLSVSGWQAMRTKLGSRKRNYPGISAVLLRSMIVGSMKQRNDLLAAGMVDLYLNPDLRGISLLDFNEVESVAAAGYEAALPAIESWTRERAETGVA